MNARLLGARSDGIIGSMALGLRLQTTVGRLDEAILDYGVILAVLAGACLRPELRNMIGAMLVLVALAGPSQALRALTLSWLVTVLNPGIVGDDGPSGALRYVLIFATLATAAFHGLFSMQGQVPRLVLVALIFPIYAALSAAATSYALDVSLLKLAAYAAGVTGILWCVYLLPEPERLKRWMLRLATVIILVSAPLIATGVGYTRNGSGFQGILAHPQFYGAFLGVILAWMIALAVIERDRDPLMLAVIAVGTVSLIATEARIGAVTLIGAVVIVTLFLSPTAGQRRRARNVLIAAVSLVLILLVLVPQVGDAIYMFAMKEGRGNARDLAESLEQSRGMLIATSFANFLQHPFFGIGFGLPSHPAKLSLAHDPIFGLPSGAPVEKGFIGTAVLEETGVVGAVLVLLFMAALLGRAYRSGSAARMSLALAVLLSNVAEVTFFSLGGNGLLFWVLLAYGAYAVGAAAEAGEGVELEFSGTADAGPVP